MRRNVYVLSFIQNFDILIHWLIMTWSSLAQACAVLMLWSAIPFIPASPSDSERHILSNGEGAGGRWGMMAKSFLLLLLQSLCAHCGGILSSPCPQSMASPWQTGTGTAWLDPEGPLCAHSYNCCCFKDNSETFLSTPAPLKPGNPYFGRGM